MEAVASNNFKKKFEIIKAMFVTTIVTNTAVQLPKIMLP